MSSLQLPTFPFAFSSSPIFINKDEFIVCPSKHSVCKGDGVYLCNSTQKKWRKIMDYPDDFECFVWSNSCAYHTKTNTLFVSMSRDGYLFKIDLNTKQLTEITNVKVTRGCKLTIVGNQLHIIGADTHFIMNITTDGKLSKLSAINIDDNHGLYFNLIHSRLQEILLLFGEQKSRANQGGDGVALIPIKPSISPVTASMIIQKQ
mmetsp:Transcript_35982/g.31744  ORF Transcript_35982/g.31744 Transcript_35982/m.31744 type:complete len:204 (+) Transcript_35982:37-648(+)